ncbi:methyl-CpG-binding domain-containing protein 9 [Nicotiana sylvestris]|uniref:Methyl-CpG-binding domain-containing protein 9 n=1 Tax=Nicotiana sylvestris TaxID=4096 RepID=A0A1U7VLN4_NICSY|nr:PREDICTED: methyl-CpG-binding domain-containing protein 9 [Nicotiana sylvestris]
MDVNSRALPFHIDLNEAPLPSPRETERGPFLEYPEPARVKKEPVEPGQRNVVRVCSSCELGSSRRSSRDDHQEEEWKCFKCLLGNSSGGGERVRDGGGSRGGGGSGVGLLDINASPPREPEGERERVFVDLNEDLVVAGREVEEQNHGAKVQAMKSSFSTGHSFNAPTSSFLVYRENGFNFQKTSLTGDIHKSQIEDAVLHRPHSDQINLSMTDPVLMYDSRYRACHFTAKNCVPQSASQVYLQGLREYIAGMGGSIGDGWHVDFKYCDKRCKTYAVYVGPDGSPFELLDGVARHLGLDHSMEVENGGNGFTFVHEGLSNIPRSKEASGSTKVRKSGQSRSSPGSSFFRNGGSIFKCIYPSDVFPVQFQDFFLISAGNIDPRPSYHSTSEIWPVGYLSSWHDRITGSFFVCEVADGGDPGPVFKVRRYPCTLQSIPIGSTVLLTSKGDSHIGEDNVGNGNSATSRLVDEESISIQVMLEECSPPDLNNETHAAENLQRVNSLPGNFGNICPGIIGQGDSVGEFLVEGRSSSSVWEMVSQTLLHACIDAYKQKGVIQFCCSHDVYKMDEKEPSEIGSLSKFSYLGGPFNFPRLVQSNFEFKIACEMLVKWLEQDRFGLEADFVQEIIEQLPGVSACSNYRIITKRKHNTTLQTVGSGFLQAKRKNHMQDETEAVESFRISGTLKKHLEDSDIRGPCPSGKPFSAKIPKFLIGDALQVWEFLLRFSEVLGLEAPFSFEEIEEELVSPWIDKTSSMEMPGFEIQDVREITLLRGEMDSLSGRLGFHQYSRFTGLLLAKLHGLLLKALVTELLSKVAVYVDPNFGAGGFKSKRGRKKDVDNLASLKKTRLDMLPINEITWPEIARRYMLALLSMEVNLESAEIACRESGKVFHCLQGDGGILCGSLTGVAALEADAMLLAEATKKIFGSLKSGSIFVATDEKESDAKGADADDGKVPEWAKALEPVRKLPTNVGARIRKCINEALEKDPPEWARKILVHSISKEVYKGNASGPTKRAVISVLADVNRENTSPKPEKEEKVKSASSVSDIIMKQCRIILRRAVKEDKDKVFCNLLGRTVLNPNDNDDEGLLGHPAMVSRPLDFRTIDLKLAAGSYGGSHESFIDDVREVWHNIRTAYCNKSNLLELAGSLLLKFEEDYENEVLPLIQKIECSNDGSLSSEDAKVRDELLAHVNESLLPKAPWEEGLCKVCGMDKDDVNVLLCDGCDSEYHTYCLDPPLIKVPDGEWYCPSCETKESQSRNASGFQILRQCVKRRLHRKLTHKFMEELSQLSRTMELKEYWELSLEDRIFLLKFLCDEVLNSAILRDHIDQSASLSAELQQKLRSLSAELNLLKCRHEILTASLAKLSSNARNSGDTGSDALASLRSNDCKLKVQEPDSGSHNSSISGGCKQLDNGTQQNECNDYSKQPCLYSSKSIQDKTSASGSNQIRNSPDLINHLHQQQSLKENTGSKNTSSHAKCGATEASLQNDLFISTPQQENDQIPGNCLESAQNSSNGLVPSAAHFVSGNTLSGSISNHMVEHTPTTKYSRQCSIQADPNLAQAYLLEISALKNEIRALEDSIAAKELELQEVSVRKKYMGQDSEGRLYWTFGRSSSSQLVANASTSTQPESSRHLWSYGVESSRQSGILDSSAPWENMGMPNLGQWTSYQSDAEIEKLLGWLRDNDMRERELKESILQWRSNRAKESSYSESHMHNKVRESTSVPSEDSGSCFSSDSLISRAVTAIKLKISGCLAEEETDICKDMGVKVRVSCDGGLYRCECLEPLWPSRPHCLSCHQTFSTAEERLKHANDKCRIGSTFQGRGETNERPSKRKRIAKNETLQDDSLSNIDVSQASKSKKLGNDEASRRDKHLNAPAPAENQTKQDCPFKFEEIKGQFITQRSLKELVKDIGLIGCNGTPSFVPCASPYLSDPALGLISQREDQVCAGNSADLLSSEQESQSGANISCTNNLNISDNPNCSKNGLAEVGPMSERLNSATKRGRDQFSFTKDKIFDFGANKYFVIPEFSLHPLVGRASEILQCLKINLLDMDAALPEEALRVSRSQSERRRAWRAFVKSAATIYEMVQATIILEDTIKTEYLRNEWWYWSSPSAAARISTLSGLALRVYVLDSAVLYKKLPCQDASETDCKEEREPPHTSVPTNTGSPSRQKLLDSEPAETSRPKGTRTSKRRKDSGG